MRHYPPPPETTHSKVPQKGPFLLRNGRLPEWAVRELQEHYKTEGINVSEEEVIRDLAKLVDFFKLVLRPRMEATDSEVQAQGSRVALSARKATCYSEVSHD